MTQKKYPSAFKLAEVILLPKPGRDHSTPKGWRLISLLSCLGKGLERLIAKRIAFTALNNQVIPQHLFGALPGRSANDLVGCVLHDIEHALSLSKKAILVTLDVQGAFDAVLHERLIKRMREKGWPKIATDWIISFLKDRSAQVRYEQGTTKPILLECGVPQGSPLSPILFLLYMAEIMESSQWRFGYADDIAVLGIGKSPEDAAAAAQREVDDII